MSYTITPQDSTVSEGLWVETNPDQPGDGILNFTISRSDSAAAATVYVSTEADQGSANDENYGDLDAVPVTFGAGQSTAQVPVSIFDKGLVGGSEIYSVIVQGATTDPTTSDLA
jgi:hypothetical protein